MWFIPYERLTIKTAMRSEDAVLCLSDVVEPKRIVRLGWSEHKPYQGSIDGFRFSISSIRDYRASFLPIISGEIQPDIGGCSINLTISPHGLIIMFMVFWLVGAGFLILSTIFGFIFSLIQVGIRQAFPWGGLMIAAGMFIFGYSWLFASHLTV